MVVDHHAVASLQQLVALDLFIDGLGKCDAQEFNGSRIVANVLEVNAGIFVGDV